MDPLSLMLQEPCNFQAWHRVWQVGASVNERERPRGGAEACERRQEQLSDPRRVWQNSLVSDFMSLIKGGPVLALPTAI